jgi:hypothetical protein
VKEKMPVPRWKKDVRRAKMPEYWQGIARPEGEGHGDVKMQKD